MNSQQRRKQKRLNARPRHLKSVPSEYYLKYKDDPRCKEARRVQRERIPDFDFCGHGTGGYIMLMCRNCPALD